MQHLVKKRFGKSSSKRAEGSKYYCIVRPLLDKHGIRVRKWMKYDPADTYWADFEKHWTIIPIPDCSWSLYICLHEIGHLVKGSRSYSYLQEYHAEKYAHDRLKDLGVKGYHTMVKHGKKYVLWNAVQDIILYDLNPNAIRKEVRAWLGVTPRRLKSLALKHCTLLLKDFNLAESILPSVDVTEADKPRIKKRKQQLHRLVITTK